MLQGTKGNITGNQLEKTVQTVLLDKGFRLINYKQWIVNPNSFGSELLIKNVPYESIYGHKGKTEFLLKSDFYNLNLRIECKWQQVAGSVDEKLPYLYLNCIEAMPEKQILILIDGPGWKKGSIEWLKKTVTTLNYSKNNLEKTIYVYSLSEFFTWANNTFEREIPPEYNSAKMW